MTSVLLLDTQPRTHNFYITLAIADALRRHPGVRKVILATHGDAIKSAQENEIDVFLAFGGSETHTALLARLCQLSRLNILWTTEDPYQLFGNVRTSTCFDIVFTNDKASVPAYLGRAHHLPLAASRLFQDFPVLRDDSEYIYDLLFIGTAWPNRVRSLNRIITACGNDLKVKLALSWNEFTGPPALDDPGLVTDWRCGNHDFARFANRSRIVLTLPRHFSVSPDGRAIGSTPPPRLFETALAGGFQVIVTDEKEAQDYYEPGQETILCPNDDAAIAAIREMLPDAGKRRQFAEAARARTLDEHLYTHRIDRMLQIAASLARPTSRPVADSRRKVVLFVAHNREGYLPGGGVEIYQELLGRNLEKHDALFMFPFARDGKSFICVQGEGVSRELETGITGSLTLSDISVEAFFQQVLIEQKVDVVHFHHLLHLPSSLPLIAGAMGVPIVWQLHDYYLICERYNLITFDYRFCDVVNRGSEQCDGCLLSLNGRPPGSKARRDNLTARTARSVDAFIASTAFSGDYIRGFFPEIGQDRVNFIELPSSSETRPQRRRSDIGRLREMHVAIPGNFNASKGAVYLVDLFRRCAEYDIIFHLLGRIDIELPDDIAELDDRKIRIRKGYELEEVQGLLSKCEVSLHLSVWPETFMLSLSEAWQADLVPIVTDLGAAADRVTEGVDGFRVPPNDPNSAFERLRFLYFNRDILENMREKIYEKRFVTAKAHAAQVALLYDRLIAKHPCPHIQVPDLTGSYQMNLFDAGIRLNSPIWSSPDIIWDADESGGTAAAARLPAATRCEEPPKEIALPATIVDAEGTFGEVHVDAVTVDNRPVLPGTRNVAFREVAVRGWMLGAAEQNPQVTYLRLRNSGEAMYFALPAEMREDVAAHLGRKEALKSGFAGSVSMKGLTPGVYAADLIQVGNASTLVSREVLAFAAQSGLAFGEGYAPIWSRHADGATAAQRPNVTASPLQITAHNLDEIAGLPVGGADDTVWIHGRGLVQATDAASTVAILQKDDGRVTYEAPVRPFVAPGKPAAEGHFLIVGQFAAVELGHYTLGVAHMAAGQVVLQRSDFHLFSSPQRRFAWSFAEPSGFHPRKIPRFSFAIDRVTTSAGGLTGSDRKLLWCEGWAFAKGYGPPLHSVVTWTAAGGKTMYCLCKQLPRPDVSASRGDVEAGNAGFQFAIPADALSAASVRLFQQYADRTLEFARFDGRLRALYSKAELSMVAAPEKLTNG
ncbi:MAG TPA: glycosyltransferase [Bradyrhizobium sp.]|nr:glycosyltransferase [Bradyrhizobium sp.]